MARNDQQGTLISKADDSVEGKGDPNDSVSAAQTISVLGGVDPGSLLAERFRVKELIQSGGMGDVYRALDEKSHSEVAVKTLRAGASSQERFEREALRLSELKHPAIPKYVAHDLSDPKLPFLVMEWLDGVELGAYLRTHRLGPGSAVSLMQKICEPVAYAHEQGVIHRDLNPTNIFLVGTKHSDVKVLDFGVARFVDEENPLTAEGAQLGTPGYMAPEQIEGRANVGAAADIFALGCVFYEALAGQRAFSAPTIREVLTRIVADDPIAPSELNDSVPPALDELVMRMLSKDAQERPSSGANLLHLLRALPDVEDVTSSQVPSVAGSSVQQVCSLIVMRSTEGAVFERAVQAAEPHGLTVQRGTDDTIVISTHGRGTASDHAAWAARCALAIQKATRVGHLAVSTGLLMQGAKAPSGRAFDSALVSLLLKDTGTYNDQGSRLWVDENTASLLDARFEVEPVEAGFLLRGMRDAYEPARTVLGRRTRCVGRKRELTLLEATLDESFADSSASCVLITGAPGIGKSRLIAEAARNARRKISGVSIFRGTCESFSAKGPFSVMASVLSQACKIRETEPDRVRRNKLQQHLEKLIPPEDLPRVSEFLRELLGIPSDGDQSVQFRAASRDPVLKGDQLQRALEDWLRAEARDQPTLLILDDFQWGDLATVRFIDAALRNLSEESLVVVALARPEVHEEFPSMWVKRGLTEVRLSGLSRRSVEELILDVLQEKASKGVTARIIQSGQGNPFWIEELLRAEHAGQGENVPDRIVLLAQSRIEQQSLDERRALSAASVYGRQFWLGGARAVLGPEMTTQAMTLLARELVEAEFIVERPLSSLGGEKEYEFASGLLRDAAYSLLEEEEKENAHAHAASWLERNGEADPLAIAMHFTLGNEGERARAYYLRAAEQALAGDDLDGALSCAEEGLGGGASGSDAVRLRLVRAEACKWRGDHILAFKSAQSAFSRAEDGSPDWFRAAAEAAVAAGKTGKRETSLGIAKELLEHSESDTGGTERDVAMARVATQLALMGELTTARELSAAARNYVSEAVHGDPRVMGFLCEADAMIAGASEDPIGRMELAEEAAANFDDAGDLRNGCLARLSLGFAQVEFGANQAARRTIEGALSTAERMGLENSIPIAQAQLARVYSRTGEVERAIELLDDCSSTFDRQRNVRLAGMTRLYFAECCLFVDDSEQAVELSERSMAILDHMPPMLRIAKSIAALSYFQSGDLGLAKTTGEEAVRGLEDGMRLPVGESLVRLGGVMAHLARGDNTAAVARAEREVRRLKQHASSMSPERADEYLLGSPERVMLVRLAERRFEGVRYGEGFVNQNRVSSPARERTTSEPRGQGSTSDSILAIVGEAEPVLRNLQITLSYHELSAALAKVIDAQNVNWSTFACWASKTAGQSIRSEELPRFLERELGLEGSALRGVSAPASKFLETFGLGKWIRRAAGRVLRDVASKIAAGNLKVYAELAPLFQKYIDLARSDAGDDAFGHFIDGLQGGPAESGGQELLKRAFRAWRQAGHEEDDALRAQLLLRANCQIGLHEQTRLQPFIQGAMDAPIDTLIDREARKLLPAGWRYAFGWLVSWLTAAFRREVLLVWEKVATRFAMKLALPDGKEISLGDDLPADQAEPPQDLLTITDPKTEALLERFDKNLATARGSGANNWASLQDRMGFIVELFRARQQDYSLFEAPFDEEQSYRIKKGEIPEGSL